MSLAAIAVLIAANAVIAFAILDIAVSAKETDRVIYAVYPPWFSPRTVADRIRKAGARQVAAAAPPFIGEVVIPDLKTFERVARSGAVVLVAATSVRLCTAGETRRP